MAYDVITQGGGEGLVYAFNAVATMFNGKKALGASLVYMASLFATVLMVMMMVAKQELLPTAKWFFGALFMTSALMLPKVDIIIKDRLTKLERPVVNVPFMLGVFAGISSQLGDILAKKMDAIFSKAGPNYTGNGVAMSSQLLAKVNHFHILDPMMASNIRGFVQQCMVFDIAKGKYSIKALHQTDDIWTLLKDNASKARGFVYKTVNPKAQTKKSTHSQILTCEEGIQKLEKDWILAYKLAREVYGLKLYPSSPNPANRFIENLPLAHHYLTQLSHTAEQILQQSMMANAIDDGLLELNQLTDANAAVTAYAAKRAQAQQKVAYALQGGMASLSLSVLKVVVEILFYGLFPIVVAIAIFPGGWMVIKKYLIALFWIQSWAPMYAILNMMMNVYGKAQSMAAVSTTGKGILNMHALRGLSEVNDWVSSVAGYTMMSVPFLSYGIIHYGAGALSQLSTHFGSVTQSAASHAAEEATTGNYNMGNTSFDNHNRHNISGFKHDTNISIATGRSTVQREDGALLSRNRDGSPVLDRNPAISNLGASFNQNDSLQLGFSKMAEESHRTGMQHMTAYQDNLTSALSQFQALSDHHRKGIDSTDSFVQGNSVYQESGLATLSAAAEELSHRLDIDRSVANEWLVRGNAGINGNIGVGKYGAGVRGGITLGGTIGAFHNERTHQGDIRNAIESISEKYDLQSALKKIENDARENRYSRIDSKGKSLDDGIRASLDKAFSEQKSAQASFNQEKAYRESAQLVSHHGMDSTQNLSNEILKQQIEQVGLKRAVDNISNPQKLNQIRNAFVETGFKEAENKFENSETHATPEVLGEQYQREAATLKAMDSIETMYEKNQNLLTQKAEESQLNQEISSHLSNQVNQSITKVDTMLKEEEQIFLNKKAQMKNDHEQFKKDNRVRDYGNMMGAVFKSDTDKSSGKKE